jgi:NDP-sugar pyrophosphorylase family protein
VTRQHRLQNRSQDKLPAAWILAGGLGTRLAGVLGDLPKVLAPIGERPFLDVLLDQLVAAGFERVVLLLGVQHQVVLDFLVDRGRRRAGQNASQGATQDATIDGLSDDLMIDVSIEARPLGTGGALRHAQSHADGPFFLLNGDTYLDFDAAGMVERHRNTQALVTMAAVERPDCRRFGSIDADSEGVLRGFREKRESVGKGWINAGVYLMQPDIMSFIADGRSVSLEGEVFPRLVSEGRRVVIAGQQGEFFDIGTPESLREFERFMLRRSSGEIPTRM